MPHADSSGAALFDDASSRAAPGGEGPRPLVDAPLVLYHAAPSRSSSVRALLEEIGAPYETVTLDLKAGDQREPGYLAINPLGKVPALRHGEAVVTEQAAIFLYLADLFPTANLAPALNHPLRGPYLRWTVFYSAAFEPALVDKALGREPGMRAMSPYGSFDEVMGAIEAQVARGPCWLGDRFTAADILWASALRWTTGFGIVPKTPAIEAYLDRTLSRACFSRARAQDDALAAERAAASAS